MTQTYIDIARYIEQDRDRASRGFSSVRKERRPIRRLVSHSGHAEFCPPGAAPTSTTNLRATGRSGEPNLLPHRQRLRAPRRDLHGPQHDVGGAAHRLARPAREDLAEDGGVPPPRSALIHRTSPRWKGAGRTPRPAPFSFGADASAAEPDICRNTGRNRWRSTLDRRCVAHRVRQQPVHGWLTERIRATN